MGESELFRVQTRARSSTEFEAIEATLLRGLFFVLSRSELGPVDGTVRLALEVDHGLEPDERPPVALEIGHVLDVSFHAEEFDWDPYVLEDVSLVTEGRTEVVIEGEPPCELRVVVSKVDIRVLVSRNAAE